MEQCQEIHGLNSSLSESAFNTVALLISDNAFLVKNFLAVCGYVRIPGALRYVSFADPWSERYIQQKNGCALAVVALRTSGLRYASLSALLYKDQDFTNGRACFGHRRSLDDSCGQWPCQTSGRRLSPSGLQISERNSTLR